MLDHEGKDLTNVLSSIVEELVNIGYIDESTGDELLRVLLCRHRYVDSKVAKWTRHHSIPTIIVSPLKNMYILTYFIIFIVPNIFCSIEDGEEIVFLLHHLFIVPNIYCAMGEMKTDKNQSPFRILVMLKTITAFHTSISFQDNFRFHRLPSICRRMSFLIK